MAERKVPTDLAGNKTSVFEPRALVASFKCHDPYIIRVVSFSCSTFCL